MDEWMDGWMDGWMDNPTDQMLCLNLAQTAYFRIFQNERVCR